MTRRHQRDLIEDHNEWIEHQYNPGYWVNKVRIFDITSWRWARKHNRLYGLIGMLIFGLGLAALILPAIDEGNASGISFLAVLVDDFSIFLVVFVSLMFLAFLYMFLQSPTKSQKKHQQ